MKFKTNIKAQDSTLAIENKIHETYPDAKLEFELQNTDSFLHIHGIPEESEHAARIESAIKEAGFSAAWLKRGEENK